MLKMALGEKWWAAELSLSLRQDSNSVLDFGKGGAGQWKQLGGGAKICGNQQTTTGARGGMCPQGKFVFHPMGNIYELLFSKNALQRSLWTE